MRFSEFAKFIIKPHLFENKQQYKQIMDTMVNAGIISQENANNTLKQVKSLLKRADRIIWWLRWWRIKETGEVIESKIQELENKWEFVKSGRDAGADAPQTANELSQKIVQLENLYQKITKKGYDYYQNRSLEINRFQESFGLQNLENHWSTMFEESPQVNEIEWEANLDPTDLIRRLEQAENVWQEKQREELEPEPDDQIIIDYGKYAWVKLDREYCRAEGRAMGHCGNTGSPSVGDRILSFRTKVSEKRQKPHLTFILDRDGYLGEMKGRGNDKPSEKYHPYIIDLLQKDFVKGIKGGGYMPENNFDIEDLDDAVAEKLLDAKPALGGLITLYENQGMSDTVVDMFQSQLSGSDLSYNVFINKGEDPFVVVDDYSLEQIRDYLGVHRTTSDIIDIVLGDDYNFMDIVGNMVDSTFGSGGYAEELFDELDEDTQEKIKKFAKQDAGDEDIDTDDFETMVDEARGVWQIFTRAVFEGFVSGTTMQAQKYLNEWLTENNFKQSKDSEKYYQTVPVKDMIIAMKNMNIKSVSEIDDWIDILYKISPIEEPTVDIENVYRYDEDAAKEKLQEEIEEAFGEDS